MGNSKAFDRQWNTEKLLVAIIKKKNREKKDGEYENIRNNTGEKRRGEAISLSNPSSSQICGKAAAYGSLPEDNARTASEIRSIICTRHRGVRVDSSKNVDIVDPRDWHVAI